MELPLNVLFLCTGNCCRSILGEALANHLGEGRIRARSAGSQPTGQVHPRALAVLERHGVPVDQPASKSMDDLEGRAVMIHAGGDNYSDQPKPLGGGGARVACGVVPD